ncbi:transposase domain-containing protein, partial [Nostoc sp. CHAB 5715]|nr:transposase domain-containing protein [Nostoc sp. CHAB 5715]
MSLVNFEVQQPCITPSQLLLAMDEVIPSQTITNAIISTSSVGQRQRILPTHVVVVLVIAKSKKELSEYTVENIKHKNNEHIITSAAKVQETLKIFREKL